MSMVAKVSTESKTQNYGKPHNWETKLGPVAPKVTPDELMEAIFKGGPDMAMDFLKSAGKLAFFPVCNMTTAEHISGFYGVDAGYIRQLHSNKLRKYRDAGCHVSMILSTKEILEDLLKRGVHGNVRPGKWHINLSICGDGIECSHYTLPNVGKMSYYTPEAVLVMAVCMFTSASKQKSQTADNLVARLISSEYVDIALELRAAKVRRVVEEVRQSTIPEVSEEFVPEVSESAVEASESSEKVEDDDVAKVLERVLKAMETSDKRPESKEVDYLKTLTTMFSSMTAMAVTNFFKSIMVDSMKEVMKDIMTEMVTTK